MKKFKIRHYTVACNAGACNAGGEGTPLRFAMVSDLHRAQYGEGQCDLMNAIAQEQPAAILMCGDIFHYKPTEGSRAFLRAAAARYPCYYVTGNHETRSRKADELKAFIRSLGIHVMEGNCEVFESVGRRVNLCGIEEPYVIGREAMRRQLADASEASRNGNFTILLAHRPELIGEYLPYDFDLILAGHAHGGQWRIPGILDGFFASGQGFFPKYTGGRYDFGDKTMILGRGLTQYTHFVPRIFNPPELVILDLV